MSEQVKITDSVTWEISHGPEADSVFPEESLEQLAVAGLDKIVKHADIRSLVSKMGQPTGKDGSVGKVFRLEGSDDLIVKIQDRPFSYTGINVALEAGLAGHESYSTPHYLGTLIRPSGVQATIMSRVPGVELADIGRAGKLTYQDQVKSRLREVAEGALASVGVDPALANWDLNNNNILVPRNTRNWEALQGVPLTIIDQQAAHLGGVKEWESLARPVFDKSQRDPRDISTEAASDDAWARMGSDLTKV